MSAADRRPIWQQEQRFGNEELSNHSKGEGRRRMEFYTPAYRHDFVKEYNLSRSVCHSRDQKIVNIRQIDDQISNLTDVLLVCRGGPKA